MSRCPSHSHQPSLLQVSQNKTLLTSSASTLSRFPDHLIMTVWPLFLLSMRALNSHAGPLLDEYELVELPELPQPDLATSLHDLIPFRQKREAGNQYESLERDYR